MARRWLMIVLVAGCHGAPGAPPPPTATAAAAPHPAVTPAPRPSCDAVHVSLPETGDAHTSARLMVAGEGLTPSPAKVGRLASQAAGAACRADQWPAPLIRCLAGDDVAARAACLAHLPDDQRAHLRARVDAAIATIPAVEVARSPRAPWRDLPGATGVPACDALVTATNRLARCPTLPATQLDELGAAAATTEQLLVELRLAGTSAPPGAVARGASLCTELTAVLRQEATAFSCPAP